ncbi:Long-chain-fatty-acid--CoA ligase FadD15 [Usitatibacter rugosus]|uniref:Long-chain-fatty-acid--CoA ligase FadD15 n=1 Tax=Usitatibacter rugosus TaxID=2732067 RepID=A0A6M4GWX4_9PROT|nr:AMP-binding protein [Usitatibacter rugosus]QJR10873.1 Long-chain-fatty-acid--CoA ligase FadD15 [Usitatibacter rugosus]
MTAIGVERTFPRLLLRHARERGDKPAIREKDLGIWQSWSWAEVRDEVEWLACGLAQAGLTRGQHLAVIGANRPRLYWALSAAQALGAIPVPFYEDAPSSEMTYVFQDAQIGFAIVEDQEQADKLFEILPQCPHLKRIWYDEPRGLKHYDQPELASYESLRERGREFAKANPAFFAAEIEKGEASDPAIMLYTSGTTGSPKGVVLSHDNLISSSRAYAELEGLRDDDEVLAYLPMAWVGQNVFSFAQPMVVGFRINCPESAETVLTDMREIGPTYYFAPPRVLEGLLTQVTIRMEDAGWVKRRMFQYFMGLARRVGAKILDGSIVGFGDRLLYALGGVLVYGPLRNALGMSRVRVAYTAGEAIGPDLFVFYRSLGVNLKQLYGSTETSVMVCVQPNGTVKPDTVGPPMKGVEVRVAANGEILLKSPGLFVEYYKNPEATREVKDADGWYHTGDAGYFDAGGQLKIIDRAKDVGKLSGGTLFAPKYLENKLKFFPHIKEAVAFGDGKAEATAMINIDMQAVGDWAERRGLPYSGYNDLAAKPQVSELIRECVEKVNADLAADPTLSGSQIHRFVILHKELDADDGELTRTRKVRRGYIGEKYAVIVEALYSGAGSCTVEAQVRFEDGRTGNVRADLLVQDAKTFAPEAGKRAA